MGYGLAADAVVALHVAYVVFVVLGQAAILVGAARGWRWVRKPWFRLAHLTAIAVVALEAVWGIDCPLTVWEGNLRELAGEEAAQGTFIGRCLDALIFVNVPVAVLNAIHMGFALLVLATLVWVPPHWRKPPRPPRLPGE